MMVKNTLYTDLVSPCKKVTYTEKVGFIYVF